MARLSNTTLLSTGPFIASNLGYIDLIILNTAYIHGVFRYLSAFSLLWSRVFSTLCVEFGSLDTLGDMSCHAHPLSYFPVWSYSAIHIHDTFVHDRYT